MTIASKSHLLTELSTGARKSGRGSRATPTIGFMPNSGHSRKGREMHGGLPFIGLSTLIYGVVGLVAVVGGTIARFRGRR
jgi:hypothetical protein